MIRHHLAKEINPDALQVLELIYDTRVIDETTTDLRFFAPNPTASRVNNSFISNPLPGGLPYQIVGVGIFPTMTIIEADSANSIEPGLLLSALMNAVVRVVIDDRRRALLLPVSHFVNFRNASMTSDVADYEAPVQFKVAGAVAGSVAVAGVVLATDRLIAVYEEDTGSSKWTDLTSEFTITADNTIDNTGGTSTAGDQLIIFVQRSPAAVPSVETLTVASNGVINVPDPFTLPAHTEFTFEVLFPNGITHPTKADWIAVAQGGRGWGLRVALQLGVVAPAQMAA